MAHFTIEHLKSDRLADAWPIVRMSLPSIDAAWWWTEAEDLLERGGGVLAARAPNGTIHGIASYEPVPKSRVARMLVVDRLTTFELNRNAPCRRALTAALDLLAVALDCDGVALPIPGKGLEREAIRSGA